MFSEGFSNFLLKFSRNIEITLKVILEEFESFHGSSSNLKLNFGTLRSSKDETLHFYSNGLMNGPAAIQTWAETVFWVIVISIVAGIVMTIVGTVIFSVIEKVIFGEADYNFIMDERDKAIASSGDKITLSIVGSGFVILILGLKFGYEIMDCLVLLMFYWILGALIIPKLLIKVPRSYCNTF
mgnify:CR=1 FL=1